MSRGCHLGRLDSFAPLVERVLVEQGFVGQVTQAMRLQIVEGQFELQIGEYLRLAVPCSEIWYSGAWMQPVMNWWMRYLSFG